MLALRRHGAALALLPLAWLVLFHGLGRYGAVNGDEIFYHEVAVAMVETGDYFRLDFFGEHRLYDTFMNAPLQYWLRGLAISLLGDGELSMRIHSAVLGLVSVVLSYAFACWLAGRRAAFVTVAVQLTMEGDRCAAARIGLTNVSPTPLRATAAEEALAGQVIGEEVLEAAGRAAAEQSDPSPDLRGSVEYKRDLTRVLTKRAVRKAVERAQGGMA